MTQFLKTKPEITVWLDGMGIEDYTLVLNDKLGGSHNYFTVDVNRVDLSHKNLHCIPVQFGTVKDFFCNDNHLNNLLGCPKEIQGDFYCNNNSLTTLLGAPYVVRRHFFCHTNQLTSLKHAPRHVSGSFHCRWNQITSLKGCPEHIGGIFGCVDNNLSAIDALPKSLGGPLRVANNPQLGEFSKSLTFEEAQALYKEYQIKTEKSLLLVNVSAAHLNENFPHKPSHKI